MKSKDASASDFGRKSNTPTQTEGQLTKEFLFFKLENFLVDSVLFFFIITGFRNLSTGDKNRLCNCKSRIISVELPEMPHISKVSTIFQPLPSEALTG